MAKATEPSNCTCELIPDVAVIGMGTSLRTPPRRLSDLALEPLDIVKKRGGRYWWLSVRCCRVCAQWWLVAQEERQNDVYCLRRLSPQQGRAIVDAGTWPSDFDRFEVLLEMGLRAGYSVRFADPRGSSLTATIEDLALERPNIRVSELARLLNLEPGLARELAARAVNQSGVTIVFDVAGLSDD